MHGMLPLRTCQMLKKWASGVADKVKTALSNIGSGVGNSIKNAVKNVINERYPKNSSWC